MKLNRINFTIGARLPNLLVILFRMALLFLATVSPAAYGAVTVTTTIAAASDPIEICRDPVTLTTLISGSTASGGMFDQVLPANCSLVIQQSSGLIISQNGSVITYTIPANAGTFPFTVISTLKIPCTVIPVVNATGEFLEITYTSYFSDFTPPVVPPFYVKKPKLNLVNFVDNNLVPLSPNVPEKRIVGMSASGGDRHFDVLVSYGTIQELTFDYDASLATEIQPQGFAIQGFHTDPFGIETPMGPQMPLANTYPVTLGVGDIQLLFNGKSEMANDATGVDTIRFTEFFDVLHCSASAGSPIKYTVSWPCATISTAFNACFTTSETRPIFVATSLGGIQPSISISPPLDLCGQNASVIEFGFHNSTADANRVMGSATKTLHKFEFSFDQAAFFPLGTIEVGDGNGNWIPASAPFYTYDSTTKRVKLDFDTLTSPLFSTPNSPLGSLFIPEPTAVFNEFLDGRDIILRFSQVKFNCAAPFYNGLTFGQCPKPAENYLIFGKDGADRFDLYFDDMCHPHVFPSLAPAVQVEYGDFHNQGAVTTFAEANNLSGGSDLKHRDDAVIDFYYTSPGPSPFDLNGSLSGTLQINCASGLTYQTTLTIPDVYLVSKVTYYPDPNSTANPVIYMNPSFTGPDGNGDNQYVFTSPLSSGWYRVEANLTTCPPGPGGFHEFRSRIEVICGSCPNCIYALACFSTTLYWHGCGPCPPSVPPISGGNYTPQVTDSFTVTRSTYGYTDSTLSALVTSPTAAMKLNRAYEYDDIDLVATGSILAAPTHDLTFRITYTSGVAFQFLGFVSGQLDYDYVDGSSTFHSGSYVIQQGDLIGFASATLSSQLDVQFTDLTFLSVIQDSQNSKVNLTLRMKLRINAMDASLPSGYYDLTRLEGQFMSLGLVSCDPYHDNLFALNPITRNSFRVLDADFADGHLGFPFKTGVCETFFELRTEVEGALPGINEFPGEFRPWLEWGGAGTRPSPFVPVAPSMTLPTAPHRVQLGSARFTAFDRPGFSGTSNGGYPVNTTTLGPVVQFDNYTDGGIKNWPLFALDGPPIRMAITGTLLPDCPPTPLNLIPDVLISFPYIDRRYSVDASMIAVGQAKHSILEPPAAYPQAPAIDLDLSIAIPVFHVTTAPAQITGLKLALLAWGGATASDTWIRLVPGSCLNVTGVHVNGNANSVGMNGNGEWHLGNLGAGAVQAMDLTLDVTFAQCQPGVPCTVEFQYGYLCPGASASCLTKTYTFDVVVDPASIEMVVTQTPITTGTDCDLHEYRVVITSTGIAPVDNLKVDVTLPPGLRIQGAPTYSVNSSAPLGLSTSSSLLNVVTWYVGQDVYPALARMPAAPASVELNFVIRGVCNVNANPNHVKFHTEGISACGGVVTCNDFVDQLACRSPFLCAPDKSVSCGTAATFDAPLPTCCAAGFVAIPRPLVTVQGACPQSSMVTQTWDVSNGCGDTAICSQTVTIGTAPVISGLPGLTVIPCPAVATALPFVTPSATDPCASGAVSLSWVDGPPVFGFAGCANSYSVTRTWTAISCGITATATDTISVVDTSPPIATPLVGALDRVVQCDDALGLAAALALAPGFTDSCTLVPTIIAPNAALAIPTDVTTVSTLCPGNYVRVRSWTAEDGCGNTSVPFVQTITVKDSTAPSITVCPGNRVVSADAACLGTVPDMRGDVIAIDACSTYTVTQTPAGGTQLGVGAHTVTFTVTDACQNSSTCAMQLTVKPVILLSCPSLTVPCTFAGGTTVEFKDPTIGNSCCGYSSIHWSPASGSTFPIGVTAVTATAVLDCPDGPHTETCVFTVSVLGLGNGVSGEWALSAGGGGAQIPHAIAVDVMGNSYVAGQFTTSANFPTATFTSFGSGGDAFLAKYDTQGIFIWARQAADLDNFVGRTTARGVAVDVHGNTYVTGSFEGKATFGSHTITGAGLSDLFLAKYDAQGTVLWVVPAGGLNGSASGNGVAVDAAGDCYVTGSFTKAATFRSWATATTVVAPTGLNSSSDGFLAKYSSGGQVLWADSTSGAATYFAISRGVAVDPSTGEALIVGLFSGSPGFAGPSSGPVILNAGGQANAFVARHSLTSANGWQWARQTACNGTCGDHDGRAIGVDANGSCTFTAYYSGGAEIGLPAAPIVAGNGSLYDCMLGSFDRDGNSRWLVNGLPSPGNMVDDQEPRGLAVEPVSGTIHVTGFLKGQGLSAAAGKDVWLRKYDNLGQFLWQETGVGGAGVDNSGRGVAVDSAGCVYVTGSFGAPSLDLTDFSTGGHLSLVIAEEEIFLAKYCSTCCGPPAQLTAVVVGLNLVVTWSPPGQLQSAPTLSGPWTTVTTILSPYQQPVASGTVFFRTICP